METLCAAGVWWATVSSSCCSSYRCEPSFTSVCHPVEWYWTHGRIRNIYVHVPPGLELCFERCIWHYVCRWNVLPMHSSIVHSCRSPIYTLGSPKCDNYRPVGSMANISLSSHKIYCLVASFIMFKYENTVRQLPDSVLCCKPHTALSKSPRISWRH